MKPFETAHRQPKSIDFIEFRKREQFDLEKLISIFSKLPTHLHGKFVSKIKRLDLDNYAIEKLLRTFMKPIMCH